MNTLNDIKLEIKNSKLQEKTISSNYTFKEYNLKAIKNLYIQDLRSTGTRRKGFVSGAIIGGMIDASIGDDSIVDGAIIGGLLGSSTGTYVSGNIYVTLQFFDNQTLNLKLDDESELMVLQEYAIKNHTIESSHLEKTVEIIEIDKKHFKQSRMNQRLLYGFLMVIAVLISYLLTHIDLASNSKDNPIDQYSSALLNTQFTGLIPMIMFTLAIYMLFNAGGQVKRKQRK